jgi:hypothetical protein
MLLYFRICREARATGRFGRKFHVVSTVVVGTADLLVLFEGSGTSFYNGG